MANVVMAAHGLAQGVLSLALLLPGLTSPWNTPVGPNLAHLPPGIVCGPSWIQERCSAARAEAGPGLARRATARMRRMTAD